jgi:hypothetical protein
MPTEHLLGEDAVDDVVGLSSSIASSSRMT